MSWTGPIPQQSLRHNFFLDYVVHPIKRHLAKIWLIILRNRGLTVIGITGSFGKTTTKDMLFFILNQNSPTVCSQENIDPVYNIPNTILRCSFQTKYLILEMGIEYPGEMDFYLWLAPPNIAVITGIGLTHTEFLRDTENIYTEKLKIKKYAKHFIDYSKVTPKFENSLEIATKIAEILNIKQEDIQTGLKKFTPPPHRMQVIQNSSGTTIIDDSYNANPTAVKLAIESLFSLAKKNKQEPVFVFGQMNELGKYEESGHTEIGELINKLKIKHLFTIGPATKFTIDSAKVGQLCEDVDDIFKNLQPFLNSKYIILIKASRSWHLENLIDKITYSA